MLTDFTRAHLVDGVEILMNANGKQALVAWPWYAEQEQIDRAAMLASQMGFEDITEFGNLQGYTIPESDCDDWDFLMMEVDGGVSAA